MKTGRIPKRIEKADIRKMELDKQCIIHYSI